MNTDQSNIAFIPARGGSKRLPGKNLMNFNGKPLIYYTISFAKNSGLFTNVILSSDDEEILDYGKSQGITSVPRPPEFSNDYSPTSEAASHVLSYCEDRNWTVDSMVTLQPSNPLRRFKDLKSCLNLFYKHNAQSVISVSKSGKKLGFIKGCRWNPLHYEPGQRGQDLTDLFFENGAYYVSSPELIKRNKIFDKHSFVEEIDDLYGLIDIDTILDFEMGEFLLAKHKTKFDI